MQSHKTMSNNLRHQTLSDIKALMEEWQEKPFRAKQIYEGIWRNGIRSFDELTNLPKPLRNRLDSHYTLNPITLEQQFQSEDGTIKLGFKLHDGHFVEGVLIPANGRYTACISSQVGCSLACRFCATGTIPLKRNIHFDEIFDQAYLLNEQCKALYGESLTNIVYMGMGEPLLNFKNVTTSIQKITSNNGMGMSPKRITVSTVGVAKMMRKLADEQLKVNFALSLHVAEEGKRKQLMPITESNDLEDLKAAVRYFYQKTRIPVTYEYTLLRGFNDTMDDAKALAEFCKASPCKINLIEYNPVDGNQFEQSNEQDTENFMAYLAKQGLTVSLRRSRGKDIDAACGQLANKNEPVDA